MKTLNEIKELPNLMIQHIAVDGGLGEFVLYNDRFIDDREEFKEQFYDYNDDELCKKFGYEPCINEYSLKKRTLHTGAV